MLQLFNKKLIKLFTTVIIVAICGGALVSCTKHVPRRHRRIPNNTADYTRKTDAYAFYGEDISEDREQELLAESVIYFGYDKDELTERYQLVLLAHAKNLLDNPGLKLRIDGHTDERGSAEYNIGLGERRAKAVERFIAFKGITKDRLITVSYGKEQPAVHGHNEEAWRMNRRVELAYE